MKQNRGFTLVELLVVMAIIAILASIVVPNVASYLRRAQMTNALSEIEGIELALTKMLADANRTSLHQLFNPAGVLNEAGVRIGVADVNGNISDQTSFFTRAQNIYTRTIYALLREGRGALTLPTDTTITGGLDYSAVLNPTVVGQLGTSYLDIEEDPWGSLYNIYPGPWKNQYLTTPFRTYKNLATSSLPGRSTGPDIYTYFVEDSGLGDDPASNQIQVGFPADKNRIAFIWSNGENLQTSQVIYGRPGRPIDQVTSLENIGVAYDANQGQEFIGGGDDVNNWDNNRSFEVFYN